MHSNSAQEQNDPTLAFGTSSGSLGHYWDIFGTSSGHYWPGRNEVAKQYCTECEACQQSDSVKHQENIPTGAIPAPSEHWTKLSLDITGPFDSAPKSKLFIVVLQDYLANTWSAT